MHVTNRFNRRTDWQLAAPTALSLGVAAIAPMGTLLLGAARPVLVVWCALLLALGTWLNRLLFRQARTLFPFIAAIGSILVTWLWQWQAFEALIPDGTLSYGYFLTPEGAKPRFWVLELPFLVGVVWLSLTCVVAIVVAWRTGRRFSLLCLIGWWLAALVVFALPSMYLDAQGNASVFI